MKEIPGSHSAVTWIFWHRTNSWNWLGKVKLPVVADVGFGQIYGCRNYDGLQVQSMFTTDSWIKYAHEKEGYVFRQVFDTAADPYHL